MINKIKNLIFILISLSFALSIVLVSTLRISQAQVQKQTGIIDNESSPKPDIENTVIASQPKIDYYLPYPGILPDHPLYWLKMIRDKVLISITANSLAKVERELLFADKRIGAAKVLIEGAKAQLGFTTLTKGEKYLEQAVADYELLKKQNKANAETKDRLLKATLKHEEIMKDLLKIVQDNLKQNIDQLLTKTIGLQERLNKD